MTFVVDMLHTKVVSLIVVYNFIVDTFSIRDHLEAHIFVFDFSHLKFHFFIYFFEQPRTLTWSIPKL